MVRNVDNPTKFLMYPRFLQVIINAQVDDMSSHNNQYTSLVLTQKVFANMRRIGKGFFRVETPLFATMLVQPQPPAEEEEEEVQENIDWNTKDDLEKAKVLQKQYENKQENIDWNTVVEKIQEKHLDNIMKYRSLKRKPISVAQARKNMIIYLKNMAGEYNKVKTLFKPDKDVEEPQKKRVAKETLLHESFKKIKAVEVSGSHSTQDTPTNDPKEMSEEDVKNMLEIIPVTEFKRSRDEDLYEGQSTKEQKFGYILQVIKIKKLDGLLELGINALALSDRHPTYHETPSDRVKMDNLNITIEEYIRLEEKKACRRDKVYNWETAMYGKIWNNKDVHDLKSIETEFLAIVFSDTLTSKTSLSCEPTASSLNDNQIDFRISFDESDDEDCMVIFDKKLFSFKIIFVNDLKTDSKNDNDKVNMPLLPSPEPTVSCIDDLDFFKDFENEFPAFVYNDALTSKSDFSTEPTLCP
nr:hypothetical protein [Tanacetum cinerariifolium]